MGVARRALITGGCGFVGVNLGRLLVSKGWSVAAYDSLVTGIREDAEAAGMELVLGDVRDRERLIAAAADSDFIVHLAAHTSVIDSIQDPAHDVDVNVTGTLNALLAARAADVDGFVFASSNAPLGDAEMPLREDRVPAPVSPYGASKLSCEALCSAFGGSYDLPTTVLRFSNVYGPYSYHKGSVVALFLKRLLDGESLVIYGDGQQTRDFVHVDDIAQGIVAALESGLRGETFHIGTGVETSINELTQMIVDAFPGRSVDIEHRPVRAGEILRNYSDITKAREMLAYDPKVELADGLRSTKDWFTKVYGG